MIIERTKTVYSDDGVPTTIGCVMNWPDNLPCPVGAIKHRDGYLPEDDGSMVAYCSSNGIWKAR